MKGKERGMYELFYLHFNIKFQIYSCESLGLSGSHRSNENAYRHWGSEEEPQR